MSEHPETVYPKKYTDDFKNTVLYCYNYEFVPSVSNVKNSQNLTKSEASKISTQKSRIRKVLKNYVNDDSQKEKKEKRFINKASESMKDNPFQRFYRFCRYIPVSDPSYFLHIIAALSWQFELNNKELLYYNDYLTDTVEKLGIEKDFAKNNKLINKKMPMTQK